jgi:hypothetical protein
VQFFCPTRSSDSSPLQVQIEFLCLYPSLWFSLHNRIAKFLRKTPCAVTHFFVAEKWSESLR